MKRFGIITMLLLFALAAMLSGCKGKAGKESVEIKRPQVAGVTIETVKLSQADEYIETSATVKAKTTSIVASRMMGTITSLRVKEGDRVHAGQVLATVDDSDLVQRVRAAEKGVEAAKQQMSLADVTYQRYKKLHDDRALTGQELDQVETQKKVADLEYERARAMHQEARVYQGFTRVTAPVSGVVMEKKIDLGSTAVPGMPLFTIEDTSGYRVEANLDEKLAGKVKQGMEARIFIETMGREIQGVITEVVPSVDPMTRTFPVKIAISGEGLRNGSYGKISIPVGKKEALLVSKKAIVGKGQLTGVYVVDANSIVTYRLIRAGRVYGEMVEVLSGLNPNERIIVDNVEKAIDGGIVKQ
ncbi:MAG: efflux RND transporter periplasmic adaptor subunit [Nitrospirae bacterium]|nr:efflux RND transporter periplasmic adaptor subunit [Nitrospirota bacterium]